MQYSEDVLKRFWAKTRVDPDLTFEGTACIIWTDAVADRRAASPLGRFYARTEDGERQWWTAHHFIYVATHGEISRGLVVVRRCRRSLCVNPRHAQPMTRCESRRQVEVHRVHSLTCPQGHLWTRDNMQFFNHARDGNDLRRCAQCNRDNAARNRQKKIQGSVG